MRKGLQQIDGVITYCAYSIENHNAVLSFNIEGWEAADVGTMLDVDYNIACRTGLQCAPLVHEQLGTDKIHGTIRFKKLIALKKISWILFFSDDCESEWRMMG